MGTELRVFYDEIPPGRSIDPDMFADLGATATLTRDEQALVITLDVDLTDAQRQAALLRLRTADDTVLTATLRVTQGAASALAANATYLNLASPTTAQNTAQIKALTRQVTALIRLIRATRLGIDPEV